MVINDKVDIHGGVILLGTVGVQILVFDRSPSTAERLRRAGSLIDLLDLEGDAVADVLSRMEATDGDGVTFAIDHRAMTFDAPGVRVILCGGSHPDPAAYALQAAAQLTRITQRIIDSLRGEVASD